MWTRDAAPAANPDRVARSRAVAIALLRMASRSLDAWAARMAGLPDAPAAAPQVFEFHAEAGAPEGALYVDGVLVGHLQGVRRL